MNQVEGQYFDGSIHHFYLNADQAFDYTSWQAPISWKGMVKGLNVESTQIDPGAYDTSCFDWTGFPPELETAKKHIVKAINDAMRIMD